MTIVLGIIAILAIYGFAKSMRKDKLKYEYKKAKMQRKIDNLNNDKKDWQDYQNIEGLSWAFNVFRNK